MDSLPHRTGPLGDLSKGDGAVEAPKSATVSALHHQEVESAHCEGFIKLIGLGLGLTCITSAGASVFVSNSSIGIGLRAKS
jgi:hypothetical protein